MVRFVDIQSDELKLDDYIKLVSSPKAGAISTFIGTTRDEFQGAYSLAQPRKA